LIGLLAGCDSQDYAYSGKKAPRYEYSEKKGKQCFEKGLKFGSPEFDKCVGAEIPSPLIGSSDRSNLLSKYLGICINQYGHTYDTPELSSCIEKLDMAEQQRTQEAMKGLGDLLSSIGTAMTDPSIDYK
jgi:hypothetical protein